MVKGSSVPPDSVVLSLDEAGELSDRVYQVRCAAEDVATAVAESVRCPTGSGQGRRRLALTASVATFASPGSQPFRGPDCGPTVSERIH